MVRFGEYSPLNPNFRNADKPILGLGEYEERRRILLEHKKKEYFEHIAQVWIFYKHIIQLILNILRDVNNQEYKSA